MRRASGTAMKVMVGLLSGLAVAFAVAYAAVSAMGYKPVAIYSGSMTPKIPVGGLVVDRVVHSKDVRVGDVITFTDPYVKTRLITHRVVQIVKTSKGLAYRTKGDANPSRDPWAIGLKDRVGRVSFSVPLAGYVLVYAHSREVRAALILVASALLLLGALRLIWRKEEVAPVGA
jgi:signal peptidase I